MAVQRSTAISLRCPFCRARLRESSDLWGPVYVCDRCGYATDEDALGRLLDVELNRLLARATGASAGAIEREGLDLR